MIIFVAIVIIFIILMVVILIIFNKNTINKINGGSPTMNDATIIEKYYNLFENVSLDTHIKGCSRLSTTLFIAKNNAIILTDIVEYLKKFYTMIDGIVMVPRTNSSLKLALDNAKIINDTVTKYGNGSCVLISYRCSILCNYKYNKKIDFIATTKRNIDYERYKKYEDAVHLKYGKQFNSFEGSFCNDNPDKEIVLKKSYKLIAIEKIVFNSSLEKSTLIESYDNILEIIKLTETLFKNLEKDGIFILRFDMCYPTSIIKQYISNLTLAFKDVKWAGEGENQTLICLGYNNIYKPIKNISTTTVNYMYYNKTTPESKDIPCVIEQDISNKAKLIASMMETSIINYYTKVQYLAILDWTEEDYKNLVYTDLIEVIKIMEEHNYPYDPYYASIATEYNKDIYNKIIKFDPTINSLMNNYDKMPLIVNRHCDKYHYDYPFAAQYMRLNILYDFIESDEKINKEMEYIYHDFMRGISVYLMKNKVFKTRVSNAFVKLWEIYEEYKVLNKDGINAFHMCEAPGQWINTTKTYIDKIYGEDNIKYNWVANSLNPNNPENIKKYGNNIINDTYGFMKNNKEKWIFGDDGTGDITKSYNILWYREHLKDKNINLITGDAGLPTDMPLEYLQKLDYAQCVLTLATSSRGANCVIKCFSPYMKNNNKTLESTGFFANLIYLYYCCFEKLYLYKPYTSRSQGGEFYIVGKSFIDISDKNLTELLNVLDNFSENINFICKKDISPKFEVLIENFLKQLIKYNSESLKMAFFLNQLANDTSDIFKFKTLISKEEVIKIQNSRFEMYCKKFNLK